MKKISSGNGNDKFHNFNSIANNNGAGSRIVVYPTFDDIVVAKATSPPPFVRAQQIRLNTSNNFSGTPPLSGRIADFDRTYTLIINSANPFSLPVALFGAKQFMFGGGIPFVFGVTATVPESTYREILQESLLNPFTVGGMTVQSSTAGQLNVPFRIATRSTNGVVESDPFHINKYFSVNQYQPDFVEIFPVDIMINGDTSIQFTILPFSRITFTFYVKKRIRIDEHLHDRPILEISNSIAPLFNSTAFILNFPTEE